MKVTERRLLKHYICIAVHPLARICKVSLLVKIITIHDGLLTNVLSDALDVRLHYFRHALITQG